MKKILSVFLCILISLSGITAYADGIAADEMETALLTVKQKVDVPEKLTEFTSSVREQNGDTYYNFNWEDKKATSNMSVRCDTMGRIYEYYYFDSEIKNESVFSDITKAQIKEYSDAFLKRLAPEAFKDSNDLLVMEEDSLSARGSLSYNVRYNRFKNGIKVKNTESDINLFVADNKIYVRSANINFDYNGVFEDTPADAERDAREYFGKFPVELIYRNDYDYKAAAEGETDKQILLLYRIKDNNAGYISVQSGEIVEEDVTLFGPLDKNESMSDTAMGAGSGSGGLTQQEIAELEKINGLLSKDDVLKIIKKLPYVDFDSAMKQSDFKIYSDSEGEYYISTSYSNSDKKNYRSLSARINAKDGSLLSLSNYEGYNRDKTVSDLKNNKADLNMNEFLKSVCPDELKLFDKTNSDTYENTVSNHYDRFVNDVRYIDNSINISYDIYLDRVTSYNINYDKAAVFDMPDEIADESMAIDAMIKYGPIEKIYVKSNGKYILCLGLADGIVEIDAKSGEKLKKPYEKQDKSYEYTDIENHWAKEAIEKLSFVNIGFSGDKFSPESEITQRDLLAIFGAGIYYNSYLDYDDETLYRILIDNNVLTEEEKSPDSFVKREDAFVYMIRMTELERIAKAENIFKVEYADQATLTYGRLGYAAVLTGLGVISGYGGLVRADDNITRAEAATMLYKYMLGK